jgi:hypothetical protein
MGMLKPDAEQTIMSKMSEFEVLMIFLKDSGLIEMGLSEIDLVSFFRPIFLISPYLGPNCLPRLLQMVVSDGN